MSKGSSPQNVTTTTSSEPSEFIRPYYTQAIDAAQELYENPDMPTFSLIILMLILLQKHRLYN